MKNEREKLYIPRIDEALLDLKRYESDLQNPEVERAIEAIKQIMEPHARFFIRNGFVITYHGSLQYNDPRNLDVDLEFMSYDLNYSEIDARMEIIEGIFTNSNIWPRPVCDTNFGYSVIADIRDELLEIPQTSYNDPTIDNDLYYSALSASLILSSKLLYPQQTDLYNKLKLEVRKLIHKNKWLEEGVLSELEETLEIRRKRRNSQE
jgi:hypothetical protein